MNHNYHHAAGLPEWATQEEAEAACAALGITDPCVAAQSQTASAEPAAWACVANYYWAMAAVAMEERRFPAMRELAKNAEGAERCADPVLSAVFAPSAPDEKVVKAGKGLPVDLCKQARAAVKAEMARHAKTKTEPKVTQIKPLAAPSSETREKAFNVVASMAPCGLRDAVTAAEAAGIQNARAVIRAMISENQLRSLRGDKVGAE